MAVRKLTGDDWELYREVRLAALLADPGAFASTHERESAFGEADWRRRLAAGPGGRTNATFVDQSTVGCGVDIEAGRVAGTAGMVFTDHHAAPMLVAMWVRPEARGTGVGRRLIDAAVDWTVAQGERAVVLWVVRDNAPAIALYERAGFVATGNVDTLPSNPCADELEMMLDLS